MSNNQTNGATETVRYANIKGLFQLLHQSGDLAQITQLKESRKQIDALLSKLARLEQAESENQKKEEAVRTQAKAPKTVAPVETPVEQKPQVPVTPAEEKSVPKPEKETQEPVFTRSKTFTPEKKQAPKVPSYIKGVITPTPARIVGTSEFDTRT